MSALWCFRAGYLIPAGSMRWWSRRTSWWVRQGRRRLAHLGPALPGAGRRGIRSCRWRASPGTADPGPHRGRDPVVLVFRFHRVPRGGVPLAGSGRPLPGQFIGRYGTTFTSALVRLRGSVGALPAFRADLARVSGGSDIDIRNNVSISAGPFAGSSGRGGLPAGIRRCRSGGRAVPGWPVSRTVRLFDNDRPSVAAGERPDATASASLGIGRALSRRAGRHHPGRGGGYRGLALDADRRRIAFRTASWPRRRLARPGYRLGRCTTRRASRIDGCRGGGAHGLASSPGPPQLCARAGACPRWRASFRGGGRPLRAGARTRAFRRAGAPQRWRARSSECWAWSPRSPSPPGSRTLRPTPPGSVRPISSRGSSVSTWRDFAPACRGAASRRPRP